MDDIKQAKRMKSSIPITIFFTKSQRNPQHLATATTSTTTPTPNIKSGGTNPKRNKPLSFISGNMDPTLNTNSQPTNKLGKWTLGNITKWSIKIQINVSAMSLYWSIKTPV